MRPREVEVGVDELGEVTREPNGQAVGAEVEVQSIRPVELGEQGGELGAARERLGAEPGRRPPEEHRPVDEIGCLAERPEHGLAPLELGESGRDGGRAARRRRWRRPAECEVGGVRAVGAEPQRLVLGHRQVGPGDEVDLVARGIRARPVPRGRGVAGDAPTGGDRRVEPSTRDLTRHGEVDVHRVPQRLLGIELLEPHRRPAPMRVEQVIAHVIGVAEHRSPERQHLVDRQPGRDRDLRVLGEVGARSEPVLAGDGGDRSGPIGHAVVGEVQDVVVQAHRHPARPHVDERRILRELVERRDGDGERDAGTHRLGGEVRDRPAVQHPPVVDAGRSVECQPMLYAHGSSLPDATTIAKRPAARKPCGGTDCDGAVGGPILSGWSQRQTCTRRRTVDLEADRRAMLRADLILTIVGLVLLLPAVLWLAWTAMWLGAVVSKCDGYPCNGADGGHGHRGVRTTRRVGRRTGRLDRPPRTASQGVVDSADRVPRRHRGQLRRRVARAIGWQIFSDPRGAAATARA